MGGIRRYVREVERAQGLPSAKIRRMRSAHEKAVAAKKEQRHKENLAKEAANKMAQYVKQPGIAARIKNRLASMLKRGDK